MKSKKKVKIVIFLEDKLGRSRKNNFLRKIESLIKKVEFFVWIIPLIIKKRRNFQVIILAFDYENKKFLEKFNIKVIEADNEKFNIKEIEAIFHKSNELYEKLYHYKDIKDKFEFLNVNSIEILREEIANLLFNNIKQMDYINNILKEIKPTKIYVENIHSSFALNLSLVSETKKIRVESIFPKFYGKIKTKLTRYLLYSRFEIPCINKNTLNLFSLKNSDGKGIILAYTPYVNFLDAISPVLQSLNENYYYKEIYIIARKMDISRHFNDFNELPFIIEKVNLSNETAKMKNNFFKIYNDKEFHKIFEYNNINFWNSIKDDLFFIFNMKLFSLYVNVYECDKVLNYVCPDIVLVGDERTPNVRTCVLLAKNKKIPVLEIQHGIYTQEVPKVIPISDKICVWGNYTKDVFMKYKGMEDKIVVTGCPKFDSLLDKKRNKGLQKNNIFVKKILLATQYGYEDLIICTIEKIIHYLSMNKNVKLIIKPHPAENQNIYNRFCEKKKTNVFVMNKNANIDDLILDADILMTISSTVGINAAILDVPLITLNFNKISTPFSPISIEVKNMDEIIPAINEVLYNKDIQEKFKILRKQFVYDHTYLQDGKASIRVANVINQLMEGSK